MPHRIHIRLCRRAAPTVLAVAVAAACASTGRSPESPTPPADEVRIGYDTQERGDLTGSVGSVTSEDLAGQKFTRVEEMIEGRFAGVTVVRARDGSMSLRIRGNSTLMGNSEPLFVIDGMPVHSGQGRALQGVNPSDIERIDILKDAGATAIYGSRGANGVVLITTKRAQ